MCVELIIFHVNYLVFTVYLKSKIIAISKIIIVI